MRPAAVRRRSAGSSRWSAIQRVDLAGHGAQHVALAARHPPHDALVVGERVDGLHDAERGAAPGRDARVVIPQALQALALGLRQRPRPPLLVGHRRELVEKARPVAVGDLHGAQLRDLGGEVVGDRVHERERLARVGELDLRVARVAHLDLLARLGIATAWVLSQTTSWTLRP